MANKKNYKVVWSDEARGDLKNIYDFYKPKSLQGAKNVVLDIRKATKTIHFPEQTQVEPYNKKYRRIVVRHFKILYSVDEKLNALFVYGVVDTNQDPIILDEY